MVTPASGFALDTDFSALKALELTLHFSVVFTKKS